MKDLSAGWEPLPLFHVFCLQGKPRGARHMLVLAAREEPAGIVDALARIAPRLATFSAMRARRKDLANLVHPGHPRADDGLREGETTWAAIDGVPLAACREDVITAPDRAGPGRTFRHSDGRSIDARVLCGAVQLAIRDAEGDVAIRRRPASDPDAALDALVGELQADGFTLV